METVGHPRYKTLKAAVKNKSVYWKGKTPDCYQAFCTVAHIITAVKPVLTEGTWDIFIGGGSHDKYQECVTDLESGCFEKRAKLKVNTRCKR